MENNEEEEEGGVRKVLTVVEGVCKVNLYSRNLENCPSKDFPFL